MSHLDLSTQALGEDTHAVAFTGDLPDWFYRIAMPTDLHPFFVMRGWTGAEFKQLLKKTGRVVPEHVGKFVCLLVLPMGWSWACTAAP